MATTASPRVSKARRKLRTACGLHPTAWAIMGAVSPRAEAKRMWQRRTLNPSDERRPARRGVPDRSTHEQRAASSLSRCHTASTQTMSAEAALDGAPERDREGDVTAHRRILLRRASLCERLQAAHLTGRPSLLSGPTSKAE